MPQVRAIPKSTSLFLAGCCATVVSNLMTPGSNLAGGDFRRSFWRSGSPQWFQIWVETLGSNLASCDFRRCLDSSCNRPYWGTTGLFGRLKCAMRPSPRIYRGDRSTGEGANVSFWGFGFVLFMCVFPRVCPGGWQGLPVGAALLCASYPISHTLPALSYCRP
jgi:hypothetical protein